MVTLFDCCSFDENWYLVEMTLNVAPDDVPFAGIVVPEEGVDPGDQHGCVRCNSRYGRLSYKAIASPQGRGNLPGDS